MKAAFSMVLFVEGNPVGYKVSVENQDHIIMNPAENPNREIYPPVLHVSKNGGYWRVEGTNSPDLIDQVIEEVRINMQFPPHHYSAAP